MTACQLGGTQGTPWDLTFANGAHGNPMGLMGPHWGSVADWNHFDFLLSQSDPNNHQQFLKLFLCKVFLLFLDFDTYTVTNFQEKHTLTIDQ